MPYYVCISDIILGVFSHPGGSGNNTSSTSCYRNRRLKLRPGGTPCLVCAKLLKIERGESLSSLRHLVELDGLGSIEFSLYSKFISYQERSQNFPKATHSLPNPP